MLSLFPVINDIIYFLIIYRCLFVELHVQFAQFDKDGDGRVTREEFIAVMKSLGHSLDADEVSSLLTAADSDSQ